MSDEIELFFYNTIERAIGEKAQVARMLTPKNTYPFISIGQLSGTAIDVLVWSESALQSQVKELMAVIDGSLQFVRDDRILELRLGSAGVLRQIDEDVSRYRGRLSYEVKVAIKGPSQSGDGK